MSAAKPKLALISSFPPQYNGTGANLAAFDAGGLSPCSKAPSPRLDVNNVTVLNPGSGQCGTNGTMEVANYTLAQTAPSGTVFWRWQCFDISNGTAVAMQSSSPVILAASMSVTCVAVYNLTTVSSPSPVPR
jgi:hypothetical protein